MDKFEVVGYSAAAICVVATLVVFFLWIMPANNAIATNLNAIKAQAAKMEKIQQDNIAFTAPEKGKEIQSIQAIMDGLDHLIVTPLVTKVVQDDRAAIAARTHELVKQVVEKHQVKKPDIPTDTLRESNRIRAELKKLFEENKVPFPPAKNLSLTEETAVTVSQTQYRTFMVCQDVMTKLLPATTQVDLIKPTLDENGNLNQVQVKYPEKVTKVLAFTYFDDATWFNRLKLFTDENNRVARTNSPAGAAAVDAANALPYTRAGFQITFQTNPAHLGGALHSLEQIGNYLITVKKLEVIRAGNAYYSFGDYQGNPVEIPLPYRDGNVQVTVDVELLGFTEDAAKIMGEKLYPMQDN